MRITESLLGYRRSSILIIALAMISGIALLDWKIATEMSFGFLYFFPIFLVASSYGQWESRWSRPSARFSAKLLDRSTVPLCSRACSWPGDHLPPQDGWCAAFWRT